MQKDNYGRAWILENALDEIKEYPKGMLTLRGLHYRLVSRGMHNTITHYKRVISAMTHARWEGWVDFDTFSDHDRDMTGVTYSDFTVYDDVVDTAKRQVKAWANNYSLNKWENQPIYPEVWIEKKALQGVFQTVCFDNNVGLGACKGYPSLTFLYEAYERFTRKGEGKRNVMLYFGDYDPSGEDIPRSVQENLQKMGVEVEVHRILLNEAQVVEWGLPPAPVKPGDTRSINWSGLGQVELDAIEPRQLQAICQEAIDEIFDTEKEVELKDRETVEGQQFRADMRAYLRSIANQ